MTVRGHARNFSFGYQLKRDPHLVSGLAIEVMGWTGPLAHGTTPYTVTADFTGGYWPNVVVVGANKTEIVHLEEVAFESEEKFMDKYMASAHLPETARDRTKRRCG